MCISHLNVFFVILPWEGGPPSPISNFGGAGGTADAAPARWTAPGVKLRRYLCVGSWNVLSLLEDHRLAASFIG